MHAHIPFAYDRRLKETGCRNEDLLLSKEGRETTGVTAVDYTLLFAYSRPRW
jgi:hypothetical protein